MAEDSLILGPPPRSLTRAQLSDRALAAVAAAALLLITICASMAVRAVTRQFQELEAQRRAIAYSRLLIDDLAVLRDQLQEGVAGVRLYTQSPEIALFLSSYTTLQQRLPALLSELRRSASLPDDVTRLTQLEALISNMQATTEAQLGKVRRLGHRLASDDPLYTQAGNQLHLIRTHLTQWRQAHATAITEGNQAASVNFGAAQRRTTSIIVMTALLIAALAGLALRMVSRRSTLARQLHASSTLWHETLSKLEPGIGVYSMDGRLLYWNEAFAVLRGLRHEDLHIGMSIEQVIRRSRDLVCRTPEASIDGALRARAAVQQGRTVSMTCRDTAGRDLQVSVRPMTADHYMVSLNDITSLRQSEQAAIDNATRLSTIMDNVPDAIITINPSCSIESWNAGAERLFGYSHTEVLHRHVSILWPESLRAGYQAMLQQLITQYDQRLRGRRGEFSALRADGSVFPIDLAVTQMRVGERELFVGIVRDISEQRAVEQMKSEFIGTVSHELRTPLTSIAGSLSLLSQNINQDLGDKSLRLVNIAVKNSERLTRLINDILDLERSNSGRLTLHCKPVSLSALVEQAIDTNRPYASHHQVSLVMQGSDAGHLVSGDSDRILQILANLISNAAKFSPPESQVVIQVSSTPTQVRVSVTDHGPGIPDSFKQRIFSRFAQADGSNGRSAGGSGLGLAISKSLVELHRGTIGFDSSPTGSCFWFELPILAQRATTPVRMPRADISATVLVCEDDPDISTLLRDTLDPLGCRILLAPNAAQARTLLLSTSVDLLLVDMHLPDDSGLQLIAWLREQPAGSQLPVIVMSALNQDQVPRQTQQSLRLHDWLHKPLDLHQVHTAVIGALQPDEPLPSVLHVEDDESICALVEMTLAGQAQITRAGSLQDARARLRAAHFDLLIMDAQLPDGISTTLLAELQHQGISTPVILFSANPSLAETPAQPHAVLMKSVDNLEKLPELLHELHPLERNTAQVSVRAEQTVTAGDA